MNPQYPVAGQTLVPLDSRVIQPCWWEGRKCKSVPYSQALGDTTHRLKRLQPLGKGKRERPVLRERGVIRAKHVNRVPAKLPKVNYKATAQQEQTQQNKMAEGKLQLRGSANGGKSQVIGTQDGGWECG